MASNTTLPGTGEVYASDAFDNAAGVEVNFQKVKIVHGKDGVADDTYYEKPFPVEMRLERGLLEDVFKQLVIMNKHLQAITDENVIGQI